MSEVLDLDSILATYDKERAGAGANYAWILLLAYAEGESGNWERALEHIADFTAYTSIGLNELTLNIY